MPLSGRTAILDQTTLCYSSDLTRSSAVRYEGLEPLVGDWPHLGCRRLLESALGEVLG